MLGRVQAQNSVNRFLYAESLLCVPRPYLLRQNSLDGELGSRKEAMLEMWGRARVKFSILLQLRLTRLRYGINRLPRPRIPGTTHHAFDWIWEKGKTGKG